LMPTYGGSMMIPMKWALTSLKYQPWCFMFQLLTSHVRFCCVIEISANFQYRSHTCQSCFSRPWRTG
jgi:hypothetical protein